MEASKPLPEPITNAMAITCYCGLSRLLPPGLRVGDCVKLASCPKCGAGFSGILVDKDHIHVP